MEQVLVIDDDHATRALLTRVLAQGAVEVHTASSGQEGLRMADEIGPDVILLDLRLPDLDGLTVLQTLRSHQPESSVIMMTAFGQVGHQVNFVNVIARPVGVFQFFDGQKQHPPALPFGFTDELLSG